MKIVITNQVATNAGDGAILQGLVKVLREAFGNGAEIVVLDAFAEESQRHYPSLRFRQMYRPGLLRRASRRLLGRLDPFGPLARLQQRIAVSPGSAFSILLPPAARENLAEMRSADLIVSTGGTYLVEHYELGEKFLQLALAVASGKPLVLFTQSLGPFRKAANLISVRRLLPRARLILLRDERSLRHLRDAGVSSAAMKVAADGAFALAEPPGGERREASAQDRLRVALSVRHWLFPGHDSAAAADRNYRESLAALVEHLVRRHRAEVTFVSTCQGIDEYPFDDAAVARQIAGLLAPDVSDHVSVDAGFHTPDDLLESLAGFDFVVATRMHMAILALCSGTPVLPIAYEFKTRELFQALGQSEWVMDIDSLSPDSACALADRFVQNLVEVRRGLTQAVEVQRQSALSVTDDLRNAALACQQQDDAGYQPVAAEVPQ